MRTRVLIVVLAVALSACAMAAQQDPAAPSPDALQLAGTQWKFVKLNGHGVPHGVNATLNFERNGHVSGRAGCNGYGGPWEASNGALHFGGMISTKMACLAPPGAMQTERDVFESLRATEHARMQHRQLILLDASGAALATLDPRDGSQ
ncbi:MAG TPA: META domain-containing protein [Rhodanobacteraceae bacterium]|nr:META domain-containing protein [Rhodanobacteraceae bacterium]